MFIAYSSIEIIFYLNQKNTNKFDKYSTIKSKKKKKKYKILAKHDGKKAKKKKSKMETLRSIECVSFFLYELNYIMVDGITISSGSKEQ